MKKLILAMALSALCGAAAAQGYAGALAGMAGMADSFTKEKCAGSTCVESKAAFKVYAGYNISDTVSLELAYTDFGKVTISNNDPSGDVKVSAISAGFAARYPLTTDLMGVGRIGISFLKAKESVADLVDDPNKTDGTEAYLGLGLEYAMASDFKLTTAVDVTDGGNIYLFGIGAQLDY